MAALEKKNLATFFFNTMFLKTGAPPTILTSLFFSTGTIKNGRLPTSVFM